METEVHFSCAYVLLNDIQIQISDNFAYFLERNAILKRIFLDILWNHVRNKICSGLSWDSSVGTVVGFGLDVRNSVSDKEEKIFPGANLPGSEAYHWLHSSAEITNDGAILSLPQTFSRSGA
jgi:hypothetical protein